MTEYTSYKCKICKREFVLLTEEIINAKVRGEFIVCPYCSRKKVEKLKETDSLKECMSARSYKRVNGALHQK
jgi:DNA-directed RNA polymerase subunit RPC12/RpoP